MAGSKHYSQGQYVVQNPSKYVGAKMPYARSSWETAFMRFCDNHPNITKWASENVKIPYQNPFTGKITNYVPDFMVQYTDKSGKQLVELIEIKPKSALEQPIYMLTKATTCPYLKNHVEKRIATDISFNEEIYDELTVNGFRRVENWMYRPVCDNCSACKSYRVIIEEFELTKSLKRINKNLNHVNFKIVPNSTNSEHFDLFKNLEDFYSLPFCCYSVL